MSDYIIRAEGLGKMYRIGGTASSNTIRDRFGEFVNRTFRRNVRPAGAPSNEPREFWALDDVSFEIRHGEVVAFIGHNGSGKSTLLRLLSRISRPTRGRFRLNGSLGALLEIGTGFHPDLTGRENVFLNAAILGMSRRQVVNSFDEIVSFAEVEQFIDTPVKYYSSGMYIRLAFSVATHLQTEILLLDEVLGVGDYGFQQKSTAKLHSIIKDGRTVILVSHLPGVIESLCNRAIWLNHGKLIDDGHPDVLLPKYRASFVAPEPDPEANPA
jgi:lipopolysaccharide transport system ATP-binding protein